MKASLKFRDEKKPQLKAKVPLNIFNLPFQSTLSAGETKELTLSLSTLFPSGPSFRLSYHPNDAFNPFSISLKSGLGPLGSPLSPNSSPLSFSAHFNFTPGVTHPAPVFFLHFKPRLGDFFVKKKESSTIDELAPGRKVLKGVEVGARTEFPVKGVGVVKMRWGVKVDEEGEFWKGEKWTRGGVGVVPRLVMGKIGIEHVGRREKGGKEKGDVDGKGSWAEVKKEMERVREENVVVKKAVEELKVLVERERNAGGGGDEVKGEEVNSKKKLDG